MNIGKIKEETLAINRILLRHKDLATTFPFYLLINAKQGQNDVQVSESLE
mgnify:CR=1 FL=1|jgi:hypothetical protein